MPVSIVYIFHCYPRDKGYAIFYVLCVRHELCTVSKRSGLEVSHLCSKLSFPRM